jgi:hypothetical protein
VTPEEVFRRVDEIRAAADDPEKAHGLEKVLWGEVLASIALGNPNAREVAAAAMHSEDIEFPRWYA